jgi:4-hydroxy-tetrahydrodipicolinate synthase
MCLAILRCDKQAAARLQDILKPLFEIVTVFAERTVPTFTRTGDATVKDKFRNPLAVKTAMNGLGMPAGPCRPPLGKMTAKGVQKVHVAVSAVWKQNPEVLLPIEEFFGVSIDDQLANAELWRSLSY